MAWRGLLIGIAGLTLAGFWLLKMQNIHRLKLEIAQVETKLGKAQEVWRDSPPLTAKEKKDLQKAQNQLFHMLPKDKDLPSSLEEISRLAREHNLADVSFNTDHGVVSPGAGPAPAPSSPIDSFPIKVSFSVDYRDMAYFLEALQKLPRLVTIESAKLQRGIPLLVGEVVLNAYYQKGELSVKGK